MVTKAKKILTIDGLTLRDLLSQTGAAPPAEPASYSIAAWCKRHGISGSSYYNLRAKGLTPKTMSICGLRRISREADVAWIRERETECVPSKQWSARSTRA
jgi:hypothetical protein